MYIPYIIDLKYTTEYDFDFYSHDQLKDNNFDVFLTAVVCEKKYILDPIFLSYNSLHFLKKIVNFI